MFKFKKTKPLKSKQDAQRAEQPLENNEISIGKIKNLLADSDDIVFNKLNINHEEDLSITVMFVDGMTDSKMIDDNVLKPLMQENVLGESISEEKIIDLIMHGTVYHCQRKKREKLDECISDLLSGSVVLVFDNLKLALSFEAKGFDKRSITEPTNENVLKGSKEAFIESLRSNTSLIRRRINSSNLKIQQLSIGRESKTKICITYIQGIANPDTVKELKKRIEKSDIDGISTLGQIEELIKGSSNSIFPQVLYTERVDKFCGNIFEGRIGILVDGFPIIYIVPIDFNSLFQAPEDYSFHFIVNSFFRLIRYLSTLLALLLPSLYVAMTTFHQEMIPTRLAITIISSKQNVAFPVFIEVLLMLLAFEVLLEAGLRMPMAIGQSVSIIGALVVGDAAIRAGILSPGVVIIIAAAGITGFVIPSTSFANSIRILRIALVLLTSVGGLFTLSIGLILILYHLCDLESYNVPFLSPLNANEGKQMFNDTIIRLPWKYLKKRPQNISSIKSDRQSK